MVVLNDGASMPQFGLGVFQTPPETTAEVVRQASRHRLSRGRYGFDVPQRGRRWRSARGPDGRVHHDQARQRRSRLRRSFARLRRQRPATAPADGRSLPDPLASAARRSLCRHLDGVRSAPAGRPDPLDRRVQLQPGSSGADHRRDGRDSGRQPDRAPSAVSAAGLARLPRRARHQDGVVEPPRTGRLSRRSGHHQRRRQNTEGRRRRS